MAAVPGIAPELDPQGDEAIANLIKEEAARRRAKAQAKGVLAYLTPAPQAGTTEVNKTFLRNMIGSVTNHNRRNQVRGAVQSMRPGRRDDPHNAAPTPISIV